MEEKKLIYRIKIDTETPNKNIVQKFTEMLKDEAKAFAALPQPMRDDLMRPFPVESTQEQSVGTGKHLTLSELAALGNSSESQEDRLLADAKSKATISGIIRANPLNLAPSTMTIHRLMDSLALPTAINVLQSTPALMPTKNTVKSLQDVLLPIFESSPSSQFSIGDAMLTPDKTPVMELADRLLRSVTSGVDESLKMLASTGAVATWATAPVLRPNKMLTDPSGVWSDTNNKIALATLAGAGLPTQELLRLPVSTVSLESWGGAATTALQAMQSLNGLSGLTDNPAIYMSGYSIGQGWDTAKLTATIVPPDLMYKHRAPDDDSRRRADAFAILEVDPTNPPDFYKKMNWKQLVAEARAVEWIKETAIQGQLQTPEAQRKLDQLLERSQLSGYTLNRFRHLLRETPPDIDSWHIPAREFEIHVSDPVSRVALSRINMTVGERGAIVSIRQAGIVINSCNEQQSTAKGKHEVHPSNRWLIEQYFEMGRTNLKDLVNDWLTYREKEYRTRPLNPIASGSLVTPIAIYQ